MSHVITIECDEGDCLASFYERRGTSVSYARLQAREEGWKTVRSKITKDYCPQHNHREITP